MKLTRGSTSDLISGLPDNITESILQYLPIKDAVRTSFLSREWRYKWITLPLLTFDYRDFRFSSNNHAVIKVSKLLDFIDRVLLLHVGPIEKFKLSILDVGHHTDCTNIGHYILFLSKHGIREFTLVMYTQRKYVVHSCLFSCQELTYLELRNCTFKCLSANKGFNNLKRLLLANITFRDDNQFESLISCSPLLETLTVLEIDGVSHLKIHAPNLKSLKLCGSFKSICFVNTPHLVSMSITLEDIDEGAKKFEQGLTCNLIEVLGDLHGIEELYIMGHFLAYLARGNVPESLPTIYHNLKKLIFDLSFDSLDEISAALCLIRNAPNLEELETTAISEIIGPAESVLEFLERQNDLNFSFNKLRVVKMNNVVAENSELEFIKLILSRSPVLETMTIEADTIELGIELQPRFLKEFLLLRQASARAEIVYSDCFVKIVLLRNPECWW